MAKPYQKYLRFLLWPGLALISAGLVAGLVGGWDLLSIVLTATGVIFVGVSVALGGYPLGSLLTTFWQSRSTQAGTNAVIATLSMVVILGLVNFLGARYDQRIDLTEAQLFTLAPESQSVVEHLSQPVEVVVFEGAPNPTDKQLLESYQRFNPDLTYRYVDPFGEPLVAQDYGVTTAGEVHLKAGAQTVLVQRVSPQERLSERQLTNKLDQLGGDEAVVVYFLQGHGEYVIDGSETGFSQAATTLEEENFTVEALNLAETKTVPKDASVVILAGPQRELFEAEVTALDTYLDQGGSLLVMVDPQIEAGLDPLFVNWGITLNDRLIVDASGGGQLVGLGPAAPLVTDYGLHPITDDFKGGRSFYPLARPLGLEAIPSVDATPLLLSNPESYAEPLSETGQLEVDTEKSPEGPFNIGIALSRIVTTEAEASQPDEATTADAPVSEDAPAPEEPAAEESAQDPAEDEPAVEESAQDPAEETTNEAPAEEAPLDETTEAESADEESATDPSEATDESPTFSTEEARMVVIGNASFATDGLFSQQLNGDVFLNSVTWLTKVDNATLSIRPKEIANRRIVMTVTQQVVVIVLALLVLPGVALILAGVMWFRRR